MEAKFGQILGAEVGRKFGQKKVRPKMRFELSQQRPKDFWDQNMASKHVFLFGNKFHREVISIPKYSFLGLFSTPISTPNMTSICVAEIHPKMDYF
jgi:hypothetical protein